MFTKTSFQKEPHRSAAKLVLELQEWQEEQGKLPANIGKTLDKLTYHLTAAVFRHGERYEEEEEEE